MGQSSGQEKEKIPQHILDKVREIANQKKSSQSKRKKSRQQEGIIAVVDQQKQKEPSPIEDVLDQYIDSILEQLSYPLDTIYPVEMKIKENGIITMDAISQYLRQQLVLNSIRYKIAVSCDKFKSVSFLIFYITRFSQITDPLLDAIYLGHSQMPNVRSYEINYALKNSISEPQFLTFLCGIENFQYLESFQLSMKNSIRGILTINPIKMLSEVNFVCQLRNLNLHFETLIQVQNQQFAYLRKLFLKTKSLRNLSFAYYDCDDILDPSIMNDLGEGLISLENMYSLSLDFSQTFKIPNESLVILLKSLERANYLTTLNLKFEDRFEEKTVKEGIVKLIEQQPLLVNFGIDFKQKKRCGIDEFLHQLQLRMKRKGIAYSNLKGVLQSMREMKRCRYRIETMMEIIFEYLDIFSQRSDSFSDMGQTYIRPKYNSNQTTKLTFNRSMILRGL